MTSVAPAALDLEGIRAQFPILTRQVSGVPLAYLDNGATAQVPQVVLDRMATTRALSTNENTERSAR